MTSLASIQPRPRSYLSCWSSPAPSSMLDSDSNHALLKRNHLPKRQLPEQGDPMSVLEQPPGYGRRNPGHHFIDDQLSGDPGRAGKSREKPAAGLTWDDFR